MSAPSEQHGEGEFSSSKLGTEIYWNEVYCQELENFKDSGEEGDVWFGIGSVNRVVSWMNKNDAITESSSVLDLGCGNGLTLIRLNENGFRDLTGVDYIQNAVDLAEAVAKEHNAQIIYQQGNILEPVMTSSCLQRQYDVCHDKGTYDAICLHPDNPLEKRAQYQTNVRKLLKDNGWFIITSCNWTKDELRAHFEPQGFAYVDHIPAPTFQFGGQTGSRETSLVFRKNVTPS